MTDMKHDKLISDYATYRRCTVEFASKNARLWRVTWKPDDNGIAEERVSVWANTAFEAWQQSLQKLCGRPEFGDCEYE